MPHAICICLVSTTTTTEWLIKTVHCLLYQDDSCYLYLTSNCRNYNKMNKTTNCVSSSVDFLGWYRGGIPGWVCLMLESGWIRVGLYYPYLIAASCIESL